MNCFIVSVDCQTHLLFEVLLLSTEGLMAVLKSLPVMTGQSELLDMEEKFLKLGKK